MKKNVKGKTTDKKIAQIVFDLYTKDPLFPIYYRGIEKFFTHGNGLFEDSYEKIRKIERDENGDIISISGPTDTFSDLLVSTMHLKDEEIKIHKELNYRTVKSIDIEKHYEISNVTIKARLRDYFTLRVIHEGKKGYLNLVLDYESMMGVALYKYFNSAKGKKQSGIISTFSLLKEIL